LKRGDVGKREAGGGTTITVPNTIGCVPIFNTLNVSFVGKVGLSPVLKAMKISPEVGMGAIRFSLGRSTTSEELGGVIQLLKKILL
jgi:hypothetical protein